MDFKSQDGEIEISPLSSSLVYNPPPIRGSAFSKPILSFSSSGGDSGSAGNGSSLLGHAISPPKPAEAAAAGDVSSSLHCTDSKTPAAKYGECLRNHAAASGGHVVDGCGEFMPGGEPPAPESMRCAACGCHRSFHRKDDGGVSANGAVRLPPPPFLLPPPPHPQAQKQFPYGAPGPLLPWAVPPTSVGVMAAFSGGTTTESSSEERVKFTAGMPAGVGMRKRFRTKFTPEQKEKMQAFAEKVGWRMQRQEEASLEQFCAEVGVTRHVFKVWMHNNKHGSRKPPPQQLQEEPLPPLLLEVQHHHVQPSP